MSKKTRRLSKSIRKEIKAAKQTAAFTRAVQLSTQHNKSIAKEVEDQAVVKNLMKLSNEELTDSLMPSQRRYDIQVCPYLLQQPTTGETKAAFLITNSEPLCYLGDMPLYR